MLVAMVFEGSVTFPVCNTWCGIMILYSSSNNLFYAFTVVPSLRVKEQMRDEVIVSMIQGDNTNLKKIELNDFLKL